MEKLPDCPRCDEELVKALGNLMVCGSCDRTFIERSNVNEFLKGKVEVIDDIPDYPPSAA